MIDTCARKGLRLRQLTAFLTSAPILASSATVNSFSAKATGHTVPSSRFALSLNPNVAYRALNLCALWKKQTTSLSPSAAFACGPRRASAFSSWMRSFIAARSSSESPLDILSVVRMLLAGFRVVFTLGLLHAAPEEVRERPEHGGARRPAPRLRAIAHREVGDERRAQGDGEAGVGPFLEPRGHRRQQDHHAEKLGPRELHAEVIGEAEVSERLRHLWQAQLR